MDEDSLLVPVVDKNDPLVVLFLAAMERSYDAGHNDALSTIRDLICRYFKGLPQNEEHHQAFIGLLIDIDKLKIQANHARRST